MKDIVTYITEGNLDSTQYYLLVPKSDKYDDLYQDWEDALVVGKEGNAFIMPIEDAKEYLDKDDIDVYEIPVSKYKTINKFEEDFINGKVELKDLQKLSK